MSETVTPEELQAWADTLDERASGMLRLIMESCVAQGRGAAMDEMLDAALAVQRSTAAGSAHREIATKLVSGIMRGRVQERFATIKAEGEA
jgi:hypothetical protein